MKTKKVNGVRPFSTNLPPCAPVALLPALPPSYYPKAPNRT